MRAREALDAPEALVLTMVLVAVADGGMTDREIGVMAGQVQTLPVFQDFTNEKLGTVTDAAVKLLNEDDGLQRAAQLMRGALEPRLRETAYAPACEVVGPPGGEGGDAADAGLRAGRVATRSADRGRAGTRRARLLPAVRRREVRVGCNGYQPGGPALTLVTVPLARPFTSLQRKPWKRRSRVGWLVA